MIKPPTPPDLDALIRWAPGPVAVLDRDLTIVAANDAFLVATRSTRESAIGKNVFDLFPDRPDAPESASAPAEFRSSLERVIATNAPDRMAITRYDVPRPDAEGGGYEERYWSPLSYPVLDADGRLAYIVHQPADVTERSDAERDHRANAILESITDAFFSLDRQWRFTYLNPQAERQLQRKRGELLGKVVWDEFPAAIGTRFDREYRLAMAERRAVTFEEYYPAPLDDWFEVNGYPSAEGLSVYFRNVTERKRAEERERAAAAEARRQGELVRTITENASAALFMMDTRGHCTYMNHAAEAMTGYRLDEIRDRTLHDAIHHTRPDGSPYPIEECPVDRALPERNQVRNHEDLFIRKDGTFFPVAVSAEPIIEDGTPVGTVVEVRDIAESRRAVEELRVSEERFRMTADHAPVLIWIAGLDKLCYWFNKPWLEFTGRTMDQEYGNGWAEGVHPDDLGRCLETYTTNFDARRPFRMEYRLRDRDGRYRWMVDNGIPLFGAGGAFTGFIGSCVDINDRIEAEEELRENDRRKDEFLAMLAHELRNPIAAIGNAAEVARLSKDGGGDAWSREVVARQVKHLSRLIDDLLDVSRITRGKIQLQKEPVELSAILTNAVESVLPLIEEREHQLHVSFAPGRLHLLADATRVEQIAVNLLTNAAKYTEAGGQIWLASRREGDEISITVRDSGVGIPPADLPRMFELFAQGDRSLARSEGGLGIGLTLVKSLAEMHGGRVTATSEGAGKGSEFTVTLPAAVAEAPDRPARPARPPVVPATPRHLRVLIIDDNIDTARGMSRLLKLAGHTVAMADDGPSAIEAAREFRPDAILLDIGLPGMNGYEVARHLRSDDCCRATLIIAISGYAQDQDRRLSREAGIDHHLAKPVDHERLEALLDTSNGGGER